mmetsp:Transcript_26691/g.53217  ORF Transcript_26691/g.53217 Transcript_26691/m.53217 type:complete len:82 (-) Transcript_26691:12-257(-)
MPCLSVVAIGVPASGAAVTAAAAETILEALGLVAKPEASSKERRKRRIDNTLLVNGLVVGDIITILLKLKQRIAHHITNRR